MANINMVNGLDNYCIKFFYSPFFHIWSLIFLFLLSLSLIALSHLCCLSPLLVHSASILVLCHCSCCYSTARSSSSSSGSRSPFSSSSRVDLSLFSHRSHVLSPVAVLTSIFIILNSRPSRTL